MVCEEKASRDELAELNNLWTKCPTLTDAGPASEAIEIPATLARYWTWSQKTSEWRSFSFHQLRMVERERFVELCAQYGWDDRYSGVELKQKMAPLSQWHTDDAAELRAMLEFADSGHPERGYGRVR